MVGHATDGRLAPGPDLPTAGRRARGLAASLLQLAAHHEMVAGGSLPTEMEMVAGRSS